MYVTFNYVSSGNHSSQFALPTDILLIYSLEKVFHDTKETLDQWNNQYEQYCQINSDFGAS